MEEAAPTPVSWKDSPGDEVNHIKPSRFAWIPGVSRLANGNRRRLLWILVGTLITMLAILALVLGLVLGLARGHPKRSSDIGLTADLGYSKYTGANVDNGVSQWLGIRYAAAPNGTLRFRAPQDPPTDGQTHVADKVGKLYGEESYH